MEELRLVKPSEEHLSEISAYRAEFLQDGSSMDGCGSLRRMEDPLVWLAQVRSLEHRETVPAKWVISTQFLYIRQSDGRIVGMIQVRHEFNEFLEKYAGNIGYSVRPSERRKGYATAMLRECLPYLKQIGLSRALVTCIDTNEASRRTILANGGAYESTVFEPSEGVKLERYWIELT